jgi:hypothetical protein
MISEILEILGLITSLPKKENGKNKIGLLTTKLIADTFETKLGRIELSIETDSLNSILQNDSKIETQDFQIEIRKFKLDNFPLPQNQKIEDSNGWQIYLIKKNNKNTEIKIECKLTNPQGYVDSYPDSGENLDALKIENNSCYMHIGTEDGEIMQQRAKKSDWFPNRLKDLVSIEKPITEYIELGFKTIIPQLKKDEHLYLHFLIASNQKISAQENISTWNAVERSKDEIEKYSW